MNTSDESNPFQQNSAKNQQPTPMSLSGLLVLDAAPSPAPGDDNDQSRKRRKDNRQRQDIAELEGVGLTSDNAGIAAKTPVAAVAAQINQQRTAAQQAKQNGEQEPGGGVEEFISVAMAVASGNPADIIRDEIGKAAINGESTKRDPSLDPRPE